MRNFILEKLKNLSDVELDILNKASDEFEKLGFHETNVDDIAKNVGIGKGTIYRHFGNKMELFFHTLGLTFYKKFEDLSRAKDIEDPYEALNYYISYLIDISKTLIRRKNIMMEISQVKAANIDNDFLKCALDIRRIYVNEILGSIISRIALEENIEIQNDILVSECISFFIGSYWHAKFMIEFFNKTGSGENNENEIKQIKIFIFRGIGIPEDKFRKYI